jgi:UDPglucose 6-dehydrogenase
MREAPSQVLVEELAARGASVCAYDPIAMEQAKLSLGSNGALSYAERAMDTLDGADALLIATEWMEFRSPDFPAVRERLRHPVIFDGRNMYAPELVEAAGIEYHAIGRLTAAVRTGLKPLQTPGAVTG